MGKERRRWERVRVCEGPDFERYKMRKGKRRGGQEPMVKGKNVVCRGL